MLDTFGGRKEMVEYAAAYGLPIKASVEKIYSTDANMLGLTHEAGQLEELETPATLVTPEMGVWPWDAPGDHAFVSLTWKDGRPVAVDGVATPWCRRSARPAPWPGRTGWGSGATWWRTASWGSSPGGVRGPGDGALGQAYEYLLQLYLDRRARELFDHLSRYLATQIYQGYWYDLGTTAALAAVERMAGIVSGTVTLRLYRGNVLFEGASDLEGTGSLYARTTSDGASGVVRPRGRRRLPARPGGAGAQLRRRPAAPPEARLRKCWRLRVRCASTEGCGRGGELRRTGLDTKPTLMVEAPPAGGPWPDWPSWGAGARRACGPTPGGTSETQSRAGDDQAEHVGLQPPDRAREPGHLREGNRNQGGGAGDGSLLRRVPQADDHRLPRRRAHGRDVHAGRGRRRVGRGQVGAAPRQLPGRRTATKDEYPFITEQTNYKGKKYGTIYYVGPVIAFYNKELLKQAGFARPRPPTTSSASRRCRSSASASTRWSSPATGARRGRPGELVPGQREAHVRRGPAAHLRQGRPL